MTNNKESGVQSAVVQMIVTMADTTWRMFVPILGLLILGIVGDKSLHTIPWLTLAGLIVGVAISAVLVRSQFKKGAVSGR